MAIDVNVEYNKGGLLPDIILLSLFYVTTSGNPFNTICRVFVSIVHVPT